MRDVTDRRPSVRGRRGRPPRGEVVHLPPLTSPPHHPSQSQPFVSNPRATPSPGGQGLHFFVLLSNDPLRYVPSRLASTGFYEK